MRVRTRVPFSPLYRQLFFSVDLIAHISARHTYLDALVGPQWLRNEYLRDFEFLITLLESSGGNRQYHHSLS